MQLILGTAIEMLDAGHISHLQCDRLMLLVRACSLRSLLSHVEP